MPARRALGSLPSAVTLKTAVSEAALQEFSPESRLRWAVATHEGRWYTAVNLIVVDVSHVRDTGPGTAMGTLQTLDYVAIGIYTALMAGIGLALGGLIKNIGDYFKGGGTRQNVDDRYAVERGLTVIHTGASRPRPMAESTLGLILSALMHIHNYHHYMGSDDPRPRFRFERGRILRGRSVGIIGLGLIGRGILELLRPFTDRLFVCSRHLSDAEAGELGVAERSLDEVFEQCEVIVLAGGYTPETHHLVGRRHFERMQPGALFVNIARGKMVDEQAMREAVQRVAGMQSFESGHRRGRERGIGMLVELNGKGGRACDHARRGDIRCPLIVRPTSEDQITGEMFQVLRAINPRWWLPQALNSALSAQRFGQHVYRKLSIDLWVNQPRYPRGLLPWDEGNTQVDAVISWENPPTTVFCEVKYLAELSSEHQGLPRELGAKRIRTGVGRRVRNAGPMAKALPQSAGQPADGVGEAIPLSRGMPMAGEQ